MYTNWQSFNTNYKHTNYNTKHNLKTRFKNINFRGKGDEFVKTDSIKNYANGVNKEIKQLQLEELSNVDFNEIEGELNSNGQKIIKDANGKTIRLLKNHKNSPKIWYACDFDSDTGNITQSIHFHASNAIESHFHDNKNGNLIKAILTQPDGTKVEKVFDYDERTGNILKQSRINNGTKIPEIVYEYDSQTRNLISE